MPSTLYDEIGGEPAIAAVVEVLYQRVLGDEALLPYFEGRDLERLKAHQRALVGVALGVTATPYTGRMMHPAHAGLAITHEAFDRVLDHLAAALAEAGLPDAGTARVLAMLKPLRTDVVQAPVELRV